LARSRSASSIRGAQAVERAVQERGQIVARRRGRLQHGADGGPERAVHLAGVRRVRAAGLVLVSRPNSVRTAEAMAAIRAYASAGSRASDMGRLLSKAV